MKKTTQKYYDLTGRVAIITGGTGFLGQQHAEAIASAGGIPVMADIQINNIAIDSAEWRERFGDFACFIKTDITNVSSIEALLKEVLERFGRVDILINNAANNPKMENKSEVEFSRFENFPLKQWEDDIAVGLTGAFLCSQIIGSEMAHQKKGVILNIASDLAVIAPDQRLYRCDDLPDEQQPVKPVTYSIVKTALIGLTRYLATYWANDGIRINAISPGGVHNDQPDEFVKRLSNLIPLGRMAKKDEYQATIIYLCSDASSYMTGTNLIVDGGRSAW